MPFGAHETMEVHEVLNEKMNMINHFSWYAGQVQNPVLQQMIQRHLNTAIQSYDQLVGYTHDYNAANQASSAAYMTAGSAERPNSPQEIQYGLRQPAAQAPQMGGTMSEQQIVSAILSCHKNSAKNHMTASLECADPNVRGMLMQGAMTCADQAYEIFLLMNQEGSYQVPTMNDHTAKTFLHTYQPMNTANSSFQ